LIALVLVIGGWLGWVVRTARIQREALNALDKAGLDLDCGWVVPNGATHRDELWAPGWLVDRIGIDYFGRIRSLGFWGSPTDADLVHVGQLPSLESLGLGGRRLVTDSGLRHLAGLNNLRSLVLADTGISDDGVVFLKDLTNLEDLDLSGTKITDTGLAYLEGLVNLKDLDISGTAGPALTKC
jgi:hypothetical protein